ncbi:MAG: CxxC-x17-CxxC domain-containing protein [archaeon]
MGDFRSFERGDDRGGRSSGGFGGRSGGRSFGGSRGGYGRDSGSRDRREMPMCDAVCAKCGKNCKVPFKPTGDKPVYCSDCFGAQRGESRGSSAGGSSSGSGITSEQFQQLNSKLDQILVILNSLEMIDDEEDEDADEVEEEKAA